MVIKRFIENPKLVKELISTLPYSAMHIRTNNTWKRPKLSGRKIAELKKAATYHGFEWPMEDMKKVNQKAFHMFSPKIDDMEKIVLEPEKQTKHGYVKTPRGHKFVRNYEDFKRIFQGSEKLKGIYEKIHKMREKEIADRWNDPISFKGVGRVVLHRREMSQQQKDAIKRRKIDAKRQRIADIIGE